MMKIRSHHGQGKSLCFLNVMPAPHGVSIEMATLGRTATKEQPKSFSGGPSNPAPRCPFPSAGLEIARIADPTIGTCRKASPGLIGCGRPYAEFENSTSYPVIFPPKIGVFFDFGGIRTKRQTSSILSTVKVSATQTNAWVVRKHTDSFIQMLSQFRTTQIGFVRRTDALSTRLSNRCWMGL